MATVTGLTAERMNEIIDDTIVNGSVVDSNLILTKYDGSQIDLGSVGGISKESSFPTIPAPEDGDMIIRTDLPGDPIFKFTDGVWEQQPRMGAQTVPTARASRVGDQTIANGVSTVVSWDLEEHDTDGIHDLVTNANRFTIKTPGLYLIKIAIGWVSNATGYRRIIAMKNGSALRGSVGGVSATNGTATNHDITVIVQLAAGDYIEAQVLQNSGGGLNVDTNSTMEVTWIGGAGQTVDERGVPAVRAGRNANQSIPTATQTIVAYNTEVYDTDSMHDVVTNSSRFVAKTSGVYHVSATTEFVDHATGERMISVLKNSAGSWAEAALICESSLPPVPVGMSPRLTTSGDVYLNAGDYVEVFMYQSSGGALNIYANRTFLSAHLVASGKTVTPFARAKKTGTTSIPTATATAIAFDTEDSDNDAIHDTVTNNSRLTCRTSGTYVISGSVEWAASSTGHREVQIKVNGSVIAAYDDRTANAVSNIQTIAIVHSLSVGDYIELLGWQNTGAALNVTAYSHFEMAKIGSPNSGGSGLGPAQADVFTLATLPAANSVPAGRMIFVSDGAAGQQARMSTGSAWINLG